MEQKKIGLALGSGGARGLAHIGVIKALLENGIPIDMVAGSSAGSLIGGLFLAFGSIQKVEAYALSLNFKDIVPLFADLGAATGIIRGGKIGEYLDDVLLHKNIEDLALPFAAVATNLSTGEPVVFTKGNLSQVIRASSAIPAIFNAVEIENRRLIDGGCSSPVPVRTTKKLGADIVIAVNLDIYHTNEKPNVYDVSVAAVQDLRYNLAKELCREANITIIPEVSHVSPVDLTQFMHGEEIIAKGYAATLSIIPKIQSLL
jgi:NTE family protein